MIQSSVLRAAVALVLLGGCDIVLGLDQVTTASAPCGPYRTITPVPIQGVTAPTHFSITPDGTMAMVVGKNAAGRVQPIVLAFDGTSWLPADAAHQTGLDALVGAHLAPPEKLPGGNGDYSTEPISPALIGWYGTPLQISRYYYAGTTWSYDNAVAIYLDSDFDARPGNVIVSPNGDDPTLPIRHVPVTERPVQAGNADQIVITGSALPSYHLLAAPARTQPLDQHGLSFDQAVLTDDQRILVYSARTAPATFEIYASAKDGTAFDAGGAIASINTPDGDEVEPWIDATCEKLYFRRVAAGQSGDPGTIFVAE
jgi:hypothetical protein